MIRSRRPGPVRVRECHISWVANRLGDRDQAIIDTVGRLRLVNSMQLERMHFAPIAAGSRSSVRRRVLSRLVSWRVLKTLERRIGGVRAGSAGLVYALDTAGRELVKPGDWAGGRAVKRTGLPGIRFIKHALAVSELCVALTELSQTNTFRLVRFQAEPYCWWSNGQGGLLKPDAFIMLAARDAHVWWLEQDMNTEDLPTIRRKLLAYLDFARHGQVGPANVMPRVLVSVPDDDRHTEIEGLIRRMPEPASKLFHVTMTPQAPAYLLRKLRE